MTAFYDNNSRGGIGRRKRLWTLVRINGPLAFVRLVLWSVVLDCLTGELDAAGEMSHGRLGWGPLSNGSKKRDKLCFLSTSAWLGPPLTL